MGIINTDFTMPGKDRPPQSFLDLKTQQGQINWLAQFLMSVNNVFDNVSGTVTTLESGASPYVEITFDDETNSASFEFFLPPGEQGEPGNIQSVTAAATTLVPGSSATATVALDSTTQSIAFNFGLPEGTPATDAQTASAVDAWLVAHPEATTTVQDNSISNRKLVQKGGILSIVNEMEQYFDIDYSDDYTTNAYIDTGHVAGYTVNPNPTPYNGWACAVIPCKTGDTFILTGQGSVSDSRAWCFTDNDYKITLNTGSSEMFTNYSLEAPNDGYLVVNSRTSVTYGLKKEGKISPTTANSFAPLITVDPNATESETVYNSITDAVNFANSHSGTTIVVKPGTYDIIDELGGSEYTENLSGTSSYAGGLRLGNNTKIIGLGSDVKLIANYQAATNPVMTDRFSIFNIIGSFELENLEFEVTNVRYCVHEDMAALSTSDRPLFYKGKYKNCRMKHNGSSSTGYNVPACIGGGVMNKSLHVVENCVLDSPQGTNPISYHNNSSTNNGVAHVIMSDTYLANNGTIAFTIYNQNTQVINAEICGCKLGSNIIDNSSGLFNIKEWNNTVTGLRSAPVKI